MERLKKFSLFQGLPDRDLSEIARDVIYNQYGRGEVIVSSADMGRNLNLLMEGSARLIAVGKSGREVVLESIGPGEIFGERTYRDECPTPIYPLAVADERCQVLTIPGESLKNYFERFPRLSYNLAQALTQKVVKMDQRLVEAEEDREKLHAIVSHKDREADLPHQSHTATRFFRNNEPRIRRLAEDGGPILITGESGVGKYQLGRLIFRNSPCLNRIFLFVNFYNPDTFRPEGDSAPLNAEEILFGRRGDGSAYPGLIELARQGTLLISGLERLTASAQQSLLDLMGENSPGESSGKQPARFPLRIITCSREDLKTLETQGLLIPGLARLFSDRSIAIPPLRERKKDLPALVDYYVAKLSAELGRPAPLVPEETLKVLLDHSWPGNEAELAEIIKRGLVLAQRDVLQPEDIHLEFKRIEDKGKIDLLKSPWVYRALKNPSFPGVLQWAAAPFFFILTLFLLFGPSDPEKNIGSIYSWALGWPMLVIGSFLWARFWCTICPMGTTGALVKNIKSLDLPLPHLFKKYSYWFIMLMAITVIWLEMVTDMRHHPFRIGLLLVAILGGSVLFSVLFERQAWCSYLCGLGGMMGFFAKVSPLELRADRNVCLSRCTGHECYTGTGDGWGCPYFQLAPALDSNQHCKLCLTCLKNCPHRAVNLFLRPPGKELWELRQGSLVVSFFVMAMLGALACELVANSAVSAWVMEFTGLSRTAALTLVFTVFILAANAGLLAASWLSGLFSGDMTAGNYMLHGQAYLPLVLAAFLGYHVPYLLTLGGQLPEAVARYFHLEPFSRFGFSVAAPAIAALQTTILLAGFAWTAFIHFKQARGLSGSKAKVAGSMLSHVLYSGLLAAATLWALRVHFN
jgi:transcriptional regulator with AAA-type ATPase domain